MTKLFTLLCLLSVVLVFSNESKAQSGNSTINPYLQVVLLDAASTEMIDVYATLRDQYSLDDLKQQTAFLSKKERQKEVVRILREYANVKQQDVRNYLESAKQQNLVSKIDVLWAANTIVFSAVPEVIYYLAENFDVIAEIRFSPEIDENLLKDPTEDVQTFYPPQPSDNPPPPQIGLTLINAPAVWAAGDSGQGILVGNLDDGCDWDHPDLINNIYNNLGEDADNDGHTLEWNGSAWVFDPGDVNGIDNDGNSYIDDFIGWDFQSGDNNVYNSGSSHGTSTSGIVCGDGTNGTQTGVAPKAKLLPLRPNGEAQYWLAQQYAVAMGVDIITSSLSYKWYFSPQPNYPMFRQLNDFELAAGVVHTNSTSNDGNSTGIPFNISAPGNTPTTWIHPDQTLVGGVSSVIGVGNVVASTDIIASSSPWGPSTWEDLQINHPSYPYPMPLAYQDYPYETIPGSIGLIKPDVSAPGNGTTSTVNGTGYGSFSGTSGATPHVGGTVALLLSANPNLSVEEISMIIQTTAIEKGDPGKDNRYGAGRIDAYQAYLLAVAMIPVELASFTALIEGFYNGTSMVSDTVNVELRNTSSPFALVDQTKILLNNNGQGSGRFYNAVNGTPYYLVVKHRNAVETWSSTPQSFIANSMSYDFTTGQSKAYGNNLKLVGTKWCIYGGDVNQDGFVETGDVNLVFTNNVNGSTGYTPTDLNGDMFTEIEDLNIVFTNNFLGVERKAPAGYLIIKGEIK